ncbi:MAG: DUF3592 domain-containing protein [Spirochaetales bacterium]
MTGRQVLSLAFRLISLAFFGAALATAIGSYRLVQNGDRIVGEIVDVAVEQNAVPFMRADEPTGIMTYPIVAYETGDGQTFEIRGRVPGAYQVGQRVELVVSARNPARGRIDGLMSVWGAPIIFGGLSLLFLGLSVFAPLGFGGMRRGKDEQ